MEFDPYYMPVDTPDFTGFFSDQNVRRHALRIIQFMKSLKHCEEALGPEEYMDWRDTIMAMVDDFSEKYDTHGLPEMEMLACQDENSYAGNNGSPEVGYGLPNGNSIGSNNEPNNYYYGYPPESNNGTAIENIGSRFLPVNSENTITGDTIMDGNLMVNFQNEFQHGRLYKRSTYNALQQKKNPYTSAPITALKQYRAIIGGPPLEGGRKTRRRKNRRRTKHRK